MKAKKIETPTSSWIISIILIGLILWMSYDRIYASETSYQRVSDDTIGIFDGLTLEMSEMTTFDYEQKIKLESQQLKEERLRKEELARQEALRLKQIEEERLAAIAREEARYTSVGVCSFTSSRKTYMDYRAIHPDSLQMRIIQSSTTLQPDGLLTTDDGFIAVALGSTYGSLGSKYRITTDTGQVFKVIKVDAKSDAHTINGCQDASGAMIEFVIDIDMMSASYPTVSITGNFNSLYRFSGNIIKIESYV
jgi:Membrane protein involved in colicin uptake